MPTVTTKKYLVFIATNSNTYRDSHSRTFKITNANPVFTDFDIADVNTITTALTGDNQKMIKSYSKMKVKIPKSKKATAQKGARITRYVITTGNSSSGDINYSPTADRSYTFNNVRVNTVRVTAYDSRKLETTVSKTFILINYTNPIIENAELSRLNGVETTTELELSGKFNPVNFGEVQNVITTAEYRRRIGSGEWSEWSDINALITYNTENGTFKHGSMNTISGFDFGKEYEVEVRIGDKLRKVTSTAIVNSGKVLLSYDKENHRIGIGTVPFGNEEGIYIADRVFGLEKNILQLAVESNRVLGSSPRTIDNWVENNKTGNKLTTTTTGVRVGAGVSKIKISAYVAYRHLPGSGEITTPYLLLEKNGNLYRRYFYNKVDTTLQSVAMIIPNFIMPVADGDIIGLSVEADSTSRYDSGTYLTVEVIE